MTDQNFQTPANQFTANEYKSDSTSARHFHVRFAVLNCRKIFQITIRNPRTPDLENIECGEKNVRLKGVNPSERESSENSQSRRGVGVGWVREDRN